MVGTGLPDLAWRSARVVTANAREHLVDVLREEWDPRLAALSLSVRPASPNHKPTFVAVDERGRPLGYGKLATTPAVSARLDREVSGLLQMERSPVPGLQAPRVLADLTWRDRRVVIVSPLPRRSRRYPLDDTAPPQLLDHARELGRTTTPERVSSGLLARIEDAGDSELAEAAMRFRTNLLTRHRGLPLVAGRLHGDWVPWNLAVHGRDTWAFDWEHSERESAAALDLVHWHLLVRRDRRRAPLGDAVPLSERAAADDLVDQGHGSLEVDALVGLGRLRLAARAAQLHAGSGLWVPGEREVLLRLLTDQPGVGERMVL